MSLQFNPTTGLLDLIGDIVDPGTIQKDYVASENISALKMVVATSPTDVKIADKTLLNDAQTIGISITAANSGGDIKIQTFGPLNDASFTFPVNACLYLDTNGNITDTAPTTGHSVPIGKSLGAGTIYIDIDNLTIL